MLLLATLKKIFSFSFPGFTNHDKPKKLKVAAALIAPHFITTSEGYGGGNYRILQAIFSKLNYSCEIDSTVVGTGTYRNGTWTGMTGAVLYKKADIGILVSASMQRHPLIDFVYLAPDSIQFITKSPNFYVKWEAVIYPFSSGVWILLGLSFMGVALVLRIELKTKDNSTLAVEAPYKTLLDQGYSLKSQCRLNVFLEIWMLFSIVLGTTYKSDLVSYFSSQGKESIPHDFHQLDMMKEYSIEFNFLAGTAYNYFTNARNGTAKNLVKRFNRLERSTAKCTMASILKTKPVCIGFYTTLRTYIARNLSLSGISDDIVFVSEPIVSFSSGYALRKNSIYTQDFSGLVGRLRDAGLPAKLKRDVYDKCTEEGKKWIQGQNSNRMYQELKIIEQSIQRKNEFLSLENLIGAFLILGAGASMKNTNDSNSVGAMTKLALLAVIVVFVVATSLAEAKKFKCPPKPPGNGMFMKDSHCKGQPPTKKTVNGKRYTCPCKCLKATDKNKIGYYCTEEKGGGGGSGGSGNGGSGSGGSGSDNDGDTGDDDDSDNGGDDDDSSDNGDDNEDSSAGDDDTSDDS
ncbi:unnamed protein product [Allacma fusca]|uniref:Uncharacterized protein n=1 Tax=Allacma fusca TaxID=39272 RepID=A0A8J2L7W6_9HEXA|nr:unnamed protein product [Allacma fusca]